jgi:hypothetical protein
MDGHLGIAGNDKPLPSIGNNRNGLILSAEGLVVLIGTRAALDRNCDSIAGDIRFLDGHTCDPHGFAGIRRREDAPSGAPPKLESK